MLILPAAIVLASPAPTLLDHVREALTISGGTAWKEDVLSGTASYYGIKEKYTLRFSDGGRFLQKFEGPISESFGCDGQTYWALDRSRTLLKLDLEDRDREMMESLILTGRWLDRDAPVTISEDGYTLQLKLQPSGQVETVKVDPTTWLPTEASLPVASGVLKIKVGDWRAAGDRKLPGHVEITDGGLTDTIDAGEIEESDKPVAYAVPEWNPNDITFDASKTHSIECKKAISGHILVHPLVEGKDVGWFILDTGAEVTVIDKGVADSLKLESLGKEPLTGVGGTVFSSFRPIPDMEIGPATLKNLVTSDLDLAPIGAVLGVKLAGVLGADFFRRTVVSIDFEGPKVEVFPREGYKLDQGSWETVRFSTGNPAVEASLDGAPKSWFRFDTGADGTVVLHSPFVAKYKLLDGKSTVPAGTGGVGGTAAARSGYIGWFELGGHRFEHPRVLFATGKDGAFAEPYLAGNIGQGFMKPFRIVVDFSGYRIALIPRAQGSSGDESAIEHMIAR